MTNREWINSLSNEEFSQRVNRSELPCDMFDMPGECGGGNSCIECLQNWLKEDQGRCITNIRGDRVRVPDEGETVYAVEMLEDDTMQVTERLWKDCRNYLFLLYENRIFTDGFEAASYWLHCQVATNKAVEKAGLSKKLGEEHKK